MKKILLFVLFINWIHLYSQETKIEAPDYKKIESEIKEKTSEFYYPKLVDKFNAADTTMTLKEKRHLYYGFTFQKKYSPYSISKQSEKLRPLIAKEKLSNKDYEEIIKLSDLILNDNPFDLRTLNYKTHCLKQLNKETELEKVIIKMNIIMDALMSSGDGISKETAFYVINTSNEYDLLNMLGFSFGGEQSLIEHYDYLKLDENQYNIPGFYFDVSPSLNYLSNDFK
jgi:hypothetical protein